MSTADLFMTALCLWREARGEGTEGMTAVCWVIRNRTLKHGTTAYAEVVKKWQFSSITAAGDPELIVYPAMQDEQFVQAQSIIDQVFAGTVPDPTGGATLYYATSIPFPASWNRSVITQTAHIGRQIFFKEA
jgi:spore germination cell wall hydrolase CwlJ-like protein